MSKRTLNELLNKDVDAQASDTEIELEQASQMDIDDEDDAPVAKGLCVECGDQPSELTCNDCHEDFCEVCFQYLHRTGNRKAHSTFKFAKTEPASKPEENGKKKEDDRSSSSSSSNNSDNDDDNDETDSSDEDDQAEKISNDRTTANAANLLIATRGETNGDKTALLARVKEHARFIPMRLNGQERKLLRLLEAALNVSEYTDKIDVFQFSSKSKRMIAQLKEMCSILAGLVVASNMKEGQQLMQDNEFAANAEWFQSVFELGRRYKIMNPEKMRDSFGKLMYMIMDSRLPEVKQALDFDLYKPIKTVYLFLESNGVLDVLDDPLVLQAVVEIVPDGKSRHQVQREIRTKEKAIDQLSRKYASKSSTISRDDICQCLYSIGDYHAYLRANCHPIEQMLKMLDQHFDPNTIEDKRFALGISAGLGGARLSHNHQKQYLYVKQSLTLWSQITRDMFMLWTLADMDLMSERRYQLHDTGQGLNRKKPCPYVGRAMHGIIAKAQSRTGKWIGSSVVHLGDDAVPNALFFLDKYLQVPRILNPVYLAVSKMDEIARDPYTSDWIEAQFNSVEELKKTILCDFFKHGFDGSGADDFYNAGSCIDGRLTSAWNWTNTIHKKNYYRKFLVTGFTGFDGSDGF